MNLSERALLIGCLCTGLFAAALNAQNTRVLTLDEAIDIALDRSFDRKTLGLRLESAGFNLKAAKGRFRTNANLTMLAPSFRETVSEVQQANELAVYNTLGNTTYQGILQIAQPLPSNGQISFNSWAYYRDRSLYVNEALGIQNRSEFFTSLSLNFNQPLFTLNTLKASLERANLNYERTERAFQRNELDIVYLVTRSFFELYSATRSQQIATEEVNQQQSSYELAQQKFDAGLIPEVEALQMEVDYARSRNGLLAAQGLLSRQEDAFKQLIGLDLAQNVTVETTFMYEPFHIDEPFAIGQALAHRSEIRELEISKRLAEISVKEVDARVDFQMNVSAFIDITGVSDPLLLTSNVPDLIESSWRDMGNRPKNKGVIVSAQIPLWDSGVNGNQVAEAESELSEALLTLEEEKKTVQREVQAVITTVNESLGRLQVLQRSEEIAQKSYDISKARFENGDITSQDLALDRDRLTDAKTDYLDAYIQYQLAIADLKRKTLWDFENNRSLVEE